MCTALGRTTSDAKTEVLCLRTKGARELPCTVTNVTGVTQTSGFVIVERPSAETAIAVEKLCVV